ncbi:MAG: hypothetical protein KDA75_10100 [Planctomycetaceae bacterium]|nr:hypothetical protein [Planctomycetaceae bacterium]
MPGPPSPFDDPVPRGFNVVLATLRIAVAVQCWGAAGERLHADGDFGLLKFLTGPAGFADSAATAVLDKAAWGLLACGFLTLVRPCWPVLIGVTGWFAFVAAIGGASHNDVLLPVAHGARYLVPLALLLLDFWPPPAKFSLGRAMVALFFLRLGIVLTFAGYGFVALQQSRAGGPFVELVSGSAANVFRHQLTTEQAQTALGVIGGMNLGLALGLLLVRSRAMVLFMAAWGGLAAMSHVLALGPQAWDEVLILAASCGGPASLFFYWWLAVREQPAITVPAGK